MAAEQGRGVRSKEEKKTISHHHELLGAVLKLARSLPFALGPLFVEQQAEVAVVQHSGREGPRSLCGFKSEDQISASIIACSHLKSAAVSVAPSQSVGAAQCDDFLVGKAHAVKDGAQMVGSLRRVGKAAVGRRRLLRLCVIAAAGTPRGARASEQLNGYLNGFRSTI